jgi:class 3 adenylate cyclase
VRPDIAETFLEAERTGLKFAIRGRLVALALLGVFLVVTRAESPERAIGYFIVLAGFAVLGLLHYGLIGTRFDRPWLKYAFISLDIAILSALMATQPMFESIDVPQAMSFRNPVFPFYFVLLGVAAFSLSPGLVLWSGAMGAAGWLAAFAWAIRDMPVRLDWSDMGTAPTTEEFLAVFFDVNFVGTGGRVQESIAFMVVAILIAAVIWRGRRAVQRQLELDAERRAISEVFGQYVPKAVADALIADRGILAPVERTATVLFVDIQGFTRITESSGPQRIVRILSQYFEQATGIIGARQGVVTQFQGDAIMATFNLPIADPHHAANAVLAALEIVELTESRDFDGQPIRVRAGVCTGPVIAGSVGGGGRQNYTAYGDTVNLAARLETLNKEHGTTLLIAAGTAALLDGVPFREIGRIAVRGLSEPVAVHTTTPHCRARLAALVPPPQGA